MKKRKYQKRVRADKQLQTRERIVEAAMTLHQELGPRDTSISAIAQKAGVQRLTVYRHFPDDGELFQACSSRWLELNPPPAIDDGQDKTEAAERTEVTMLAFYRYYRETRAMWESVYRDAGEVPAMRAPLQAFDAYLDDAHRSLAKAWHPISSQAGERWLRATLKHALRFQTWQTLEEQGLEDADKAHLVLIWLKGSLDGQER